MHGKVADYGESREQDSNNTMTSTGTALWMAPEVSLGERYNHRADSFSFAIILYEVMDEQLPFADVKGLSGVGLAVRVAMDGLRPSLEGPGGNPDRPRDEWDARIKALIKRCWDQKAEHRADFSEIIVELDAVVDSIFGSKEGDNGKAMGDSEVEGDSENASKDENTANEKGMKDKEEEKRGAKDELWRLIQTDVNRLRKGDRLGKG